MNELGDIPQELETIRLELEDIWRDLARPEIEEMHNMEGNVTADEGVAILLDAVRRAREDTDAFLAVMVQKVEASSAADDLKSAVIVALKSDLSQRNFLANPITILNDRYASDPDQTEADKRSRMSGHVSVVREQIAVQNREINRIEDEVSRVLAGSNSL